MNDDEFAEFMGRPRRNLFRLTAGKKLWSEQDLALVVAKDEKQAIAAMTSGSDSLWVTVSKVEDLGTLYSNAGGVVLPYGYE